jgi:hypothetical protein
MNLITILTFLDQTLIGIDFIGTEAPNTWLEILKLRIPVSLGAGGMILALLTLSFRPKQFVSH